jgi:general stress protein 26
MVMQVWELNKDKTVGLFMQDHSKWVSVNGTAELSQDKAKISELWNESLRPWFPHGKDTPAIALIHVTPTLGEFWDDSGIINKLKFVAEVSKSFVTKEYVKAKDIGETGKVNLQTGQPLSQIGTEERK